jgi:hypothetical protein
MAYRNAITSATLVSLLLAGCGGGGGGDVVAIDTGASSPLGGGTNTTAGGGTSITTTGGTTTMRGGATTTVTGDGTTITARTGVPTPLSAAFQVNTTTAGVQNAPAMASLEDGGYVIAWHTDEPGANGIFVRRFAADGTPDGAQTRIDEPMAGRRVSVAKVTGLEGGGYAVAWQSRTPDFDQWAVHVRHVRADGSLAPVHDDAVRLFHTYEVVSLAGGGYALLLQGPTTTVVGDQHLRMERFAANDALLDSQLVEAGAVIQSSVHAAVLADGRRVVSWVRDDGAIGGTVGLFFRFMSADGTLDPVAHAGGASDASAAYVPAALRDGGFAIAGTFTNQAGSQQAVLVQRYAADGTPVGDRIRVDDEADVAALGTACTTSDKGGIHPCPFPLQLNAAIAGTDEGGFVVAWQTPDRQRPGRFVYARRFDAAGNRLGPPSAVDATSPEQDLPVVRDAGEGFVVTWIGRDADQSGIFARHYRNGELR